MTDDFERKDVAAERYRSIQQFLRSMDERLGRMEVSLQKLEVDTRAELSALNERAKQERRAKLAPLGIGAAGGGVIAAIAELVKRVLS